MELAEKWAERSTCPRKSVGAVIVGEGKRVLSQGYNGAPAGHSHCMDVGCREHPVSSGCTRAVHAEMNALLHAYRHGIDLRGTTLYVTVSPCLACASLLVQQGVSHVIYREEYRDPSAVVWLREAGVVCTEV